MLLNCRGVAEAQTRHVYDSLIRNHVIPVLGQQRLTALHAQSLEKFFWSRNLSPASTKVLKGVISAALNDAVKWRFLRSNPVALTSTPKLERAEANRISAAVATSIMEAFKGDTFEPLITVALGTGLRQGELLALRWQDIDFEAKKLYVEATMHTKGRTFQRMEPKTKASRRAVPLATFVLDALKLQQENQKSRKLLASKWTPVAGLEDLVFTGENGKPLLGDHVTRRFQAKLADAGLGHRRFHELRHGFATLLLAQGVDMRVIMELMGHTAMQTTALVYTAAVPELHKSAAEKLDSALS
jgi:integrase